MTVGQYFHDKPFAMLNWHRNWCEKQCMYPFCFSHDSNAGKVKHTWQNCPYRQMCFTAFINSDSSIEKGATNG